MASKIDTGFGKDKHRFKRTAAFTARPEGRAAPWDEQETTMSIMSAIGRYGAAIRNARHAAQSERMLNRLPLEIQKDIGWPAPEHGRHHRKRAIHMSPDR